jgi:hypothetical protein
MKTIQSLVQSRIPTSAVAIAALISSTAWCLGAAIYCATTAWRHDWSATPLGWMLVVLVTPPVCFASGLLLVDARKHSRFSPFERYALAAIALPVTLGTLLAVWAVKILFTMTA